MARRKSETLLEAKLEEAKRLEAEIRRLKNVARDRQKAEDEQRQKVVGRVVLARLKSQPDGELARAVMTLLGEALKRPAERALFPELPPQPGVADAESPGETAGEKAPPAAVSA